MQFSNKIATFVTQHGNTNTIIFSFLKRIQMKYKTIAFFNINYPFGGGEVVSYNLSSYFSKLGIQIIQYALHVNIDALDSKFDFISFYQLPDSKNIDSRGNINFLIDSLNKNEIDILIVQGVKDFPFKEIRNHTNCKILFCIHSKPMWEAEAMRLLRLSDIKNPTILRKLEFLCFRRPKYKYTKYLEKKLINEYNNKIRYIDKLILLSKEYESDFAKIINDPVYCKNPEAYKNKVISINNPIPEVQYSISELSEKKNIVLYVGRLNYIDKRVDRLIKIWKVIEKNNPDWELHIIGSGPEEEHLKAMVKKNKINSLTFKGHMGDIATELRQSRIICLTSSFEGLPMSLIEGQQFGVIPIAFDSFSAIKDIINDGDTGFSVPAFNMHEYARILEQIMKDKSLQTKIQKSCLANSKKFNLSVIGEQWIELFNAL